MLILNALLARWQAYRIYRDTVYELGALDDRTLADMGFQRSDIEFIARKAAAAAN